MDPQRWAKIESLYHAVLKKEPSERSRYLAHACAGDSDLRHEVETLIGCADAELKSPTADAFLSELRQKDPELQDQVQRLLRGREDTVTIPGGGNAASQLNRNPGVNDLTRNLRRPPSNCLTRTPFSTQLARPMSKQDSPGG